MKTFSIISMISLTIFLSSLFLINSSHLQMNKPLVSVLDTCKNLNLNFDLDKERLSGDWYLVLITSNYYTERYPNCWMVNFNNLNSAIAEATPINRRFTANSIELSLLMTPINKNSFYYERDGLPVRLTFLKSDYENYAIFYACLDINKDGSYFYVAGVLGRNKSLPQEILNQLEKEITKFTGFESFRNVTQDDEVCND